MQLLKKRLYDDFIQGEQFFILAFQNYLNFFKVKNIEMRHLD